MDTAGCGGPGFVYAGEKKTCSKKKGERGNDTAEVETELIDAVGEEAQSQSGGNRRVFFRLGGKRKGAKKPHEGQDAFRRKMKKMWGRDKTAKMFRRPR